MEVNMYLHEIYRDDCSDVGLLPLQESSSLTTRCHSLKLAKRSSCNSVTAEFLQQHNTKILTKTDGSLN